MSIHGLSADPHSSTASSRLDWTDPPPSPADLNGLFRFAERPNLVSARVPSRFERALLRAPDVYTTEVKRPECETDRPPPNVEDKNA